jgi:hypothetical protein
MAIKKIVLPLAVSLLFLSSLAAWGLAPGNPDIFVQVSPTSQDVSAGGSGAFSVTVISQEGFEDDVELTAADLPAGVTVTFDPNPVNVPAFGQGDTQMTVNAAADAPTGTITVTFTAQGVTETDIEQSKDVTVNIAGGGSSPPPSGSSPPPSGSSPPPSGSSPPPSGSSPPPSGGIVTTTVTTTKTVTTSVVSTVTEVLTTRTEPLSTKTTIDNFAPANDLTLPVTALVAVVALLAVAAIMLRRRD